MNRGDIIRSMQGEAKEEVRARLAIEDIIGEYVQLKRAGRNFKGLSPFSGEKTPSFFVSPEKQIWHDFSSNRGGDVFSFVMEAEGMDFRQALEHLARKAGVDLTIYQSAGGKKISDRKKRLLAAHSLAAKYYQTTLVRNEHAIEYVFGKRKLSKEIVTDFQIGYAPDTGDALVRFLGKKNFSTEELRDSGLTNRYGGDLFRGRMMVPLMDASGQVIGFTGRIIGDVENAPKYLNTSQTLLYDKGRHVFGLSQAKEAIRSNGYVVIVEGNLDVVSSHQVDVRQVVATAGTAMTEHHLRALKRLTEDIRLCFDGDKAGIAATERAVGIASQLNIELSIITLPGDAKDPDELIQQDAGAWQKAITSSQPAVDWVIEQYAEREDLSSASGKRAFTSASLALISRLDDSVVRDHYEELVAKKIGSSREAVRRKAEQLTEQPDDVLKRSVVSDALPSDGRFNYQDDLLAIASIEPSSQELFGQFPAERLLGEARQSLARYFARNPGRELVDVPEELHQFDTYVKIVQLKADERYRAWSTDDRYFEAARLVRQVEKEHKKNQKAELTDRLREAETNGDDIAAEKLRTELNELIKEIARGR
ncbi:DNA primase [Candidatus Saccharibacteria bacterium]|nr:DNA primase [Candidatus Saccharibacteria bacterium]